MGFRYFPFDCQNLELRVRMDPSIHQDQVRFDTQGIISRSFIERVALHSNDQVTLLAGWEVKAVTQREDPYGLADTYRELYAGDPPPANPLLAFLDRAHSGVWLWFTKPPYGTVGTALTVAHAPLNENVSEALFVISIQRRT